MTEITEAAVGGSQMAERARAMTTPQMTPEEARPISEEALKLAHAEITEVLDDHLADVFQAITDEERTDGWTVEISAGAAFVAKEALAIAALSRPQEVTDEMVERAAKALWDFDLRDGETYWDSACGGKKKLDQFFKVRVKWQRKQARAALTAALETPDAP